MKDQCGNDGGCSCVILMSYAAEFIKDVGFADLGTCRFSSY